MLHLRNIFWIWIFKISLLSTFQPAKSKNSKTLRNIFVNLISIFLQRFLLQLIICTMYSSIYFFRCIFFSSLEHMHTIYPDASNLDFLNKQQKLMRIYRVQNLKIQLKFTKTIKWGCLFILSEIDRLALMVFK